jgi:hypothetical protein
VRVEEQTMKRRTPDAGRRLQLDDSVARDAKRLLLRYGAPIHVVEALSDDERISYARCRVEVQQRLDGSLVIIYQGEPVAAQCAPTEAAAPRPSYSTSTSTSTHGEPAQDARREDLTAWTTRPPAPSHPRSIPARNHPWRQGFKRRVTQS